MKFNKLILASFIYFFCSSLSAQEKFNNEIEQIHQYISEINSSVLFENDLLISKRNEAFIDGSFVPVDSIDYLYDSNNNLEFTITYFWVDQELVNRRKISQEFDDNNNRTYYLWQDWVEDEWMNFLQVNYDYGPDNLISSLIVQRFDENGNWVNLNYDEFTHDSDGLLIEATRDDWINEQWQPRHILTYSYNSNNDLIERLSKIWDGSVFNNNNLTTRTYDDQHQLTSILYQTYSDLDQLTNQSFTDFSYNANNQEIREVLSFWNDEQQAWEPSSSWDSTYDERENLSNVIIQDWSSDNSDWEIERKDYYFYRLESSLHEIESTINFEVFPNPNEGNFEITFDHASSDKVQLEVYTFDGKKVAEMLLDSRDGKSNINLSQLGKGSYTLKVNSQEGSISKKIFISN